jgi:hypothetical protein
VDVPDQLLSLVRKEVVRPDQAVIAGDDAFRFRHLLIRDTAYEGLPKAVRAELHERFADWLEANVELVEQDEILGYHLEQAALYRGELADPTTVTAGRRAARHLARAGRAALERGDVHATRNLLVRALALLGESDERRRLIPDLIEALVESRDEADEVVALLDELELGDARDRALATVLRVKDYPTGNVDDLLRRLDEAEAVLGDVGDTIGLARCETSRAWVYWSACRAGAAYGAYRRAYDLFAGEDRGAVRRDVIFGMCLSAVFSGMPVAAFRELLDSLDHQAANAGPLLAATLATFRARVEYGAGTGTLESLRAATRVETELLEQTGNDVSAIAGHMYERVVVPWLDGDAPAVEQGARERVEMTSRVATRVYHANSLAGWAIALCDIGDSERASAAIAEARALADPDDLADQIELDLADGYVHALGHDRDGARLFLERARARAEGVDMYSPAHDFRSVEAHVRVAMGDIAGARELFEELLRSSEERGFRRVADRFRRDLAALDGFS